MSAQLFEAWATVANGFAAYATGFRAACRPRPQRSPADWADENRTITTKESAHPGRWRTDRTPYLRIVLDWLAASDPTQRVILQCGTQIGKTEIILCWWGSTVSDGPCPFMIVQPTSDTGKRFSRQRVQPMVENTPVLLRTIGRRKSRDDGNTVREKHYPGGMLVIAGANSIADLRSTPVRYAAEDEVDIFPHDLDKQGSVDGLVDRRTSSFGRRRKRLRVSSPTISGASIIGADYEASSQGELEVPCPGCETWDVISDEQLTPEGFYLCPHCAEIFTEGECKSHWYNQPAGPQLRVKHNQPEHATKGLHIPSWYSALGIGYTWAEVVRMRDDAGGDPLKEKEYCNTIQGLPWEDKANKIDEISLLQRRSPDWHQRDIPIGCLLLTGSVDIQINRFICNIWGWARGDVSYWIDSIELPGSPLERSDFEQVDRYFERPLVNAFGQSMSVSAIGVDSGNWTQLVYEFVRPRMAFGYHAVKGTGIVGKPVIATRPSLVDYNAAGHVIKNGISLWHIGVESAKAVILARIKADENRIPEEQYVRLPKDVPDDHVAQLTAERFDPDRGRHVKLVHRRNDHLDGVVYAYAMALHPQIGIHRYSEADWQALEDRYEPRQPQLFEQPADAKTPAKPEPSEGVGRRGGGSFISPRRY